MIKYKRLRWRTIIHVSTVTAIILGVLALYIFLNGMQRDYELELSQVSRDVTRIESMTRSLDERVIKAQKSLKLYETIAASSGGVDKALNRTWAKEKLDALKDTYQLSSLSLKMSPVQELKSGVSAKDTTVVIETEVTLSFGGLTDTHLLSFVETLLKEFSGYSRIDFLRLRRLGKMDNNTLIMASQGKIQELVGGELVFHWMALRNNDEAEKQP